MWLLCQFGVIWVSCCPWSFITKNAKRQLRNNSEIQNTIASNYMYVLHHFEFFCCCTTWTWSALRLMSTYVCVWAVSAVYNLETYGRKCRQEEKKENKKTHRPWLSVSVIYSAIDAWLRLSRQSNRTVSTGFCLFSSIFLVFSGFSLSYTTEKCTLRTLCLPWAPVTRHPPSYMKVNASHS